MDHSNPFTAAAVHFFNGLAVVATIAGIKTQDVIYLGVGFVGICISLTALLCSRSDASRNYKENKKRTEILERYLSSNNEVSKSSVEVIKKAAEKGLI